jgi:hypothetical protein
VTINCFGLERCVTFAHVWLHQRTGAPLINTHCEPLPGGRYRIVFHPKTEFPAGASLQEMAQAWLGPVRAGRSEKSRPLALDVQALALSPARGGSGGVSILREYFGRIRAPSR